MYNVFACRDLTNPLQELVAGIWQSPKRYW